MKVADLIAKLQALPQDAAVLVTDSACCGCSSGPVDRVEIVDGGRAVILDGDRFAKRPLIA